MPLNSQNSKDRNLLKPMSSSGTQRSKSNALMEDKNIYANNNNSKNVKLKKTGIPTPKHPMISKNPLLNTFSK